MRLGSKPQGVSYPTEKLAEINVYEVIVYS